jgi:hypothetical protein
MIRKLSSAIAIVLALSFCAEISLASDADETATITGQNSAYLEAVKEPETNEIGIDMSQIESGLSVEALYQLTNQPEPKLCEPATHATAKQGGATVPISE